MGKEEIKPPTQAEKVKQIYRQGLSAKALGLDLANAKFGMRLDTPEEVAAHNYEITRLQLIMGPENLTRFIEEVADLILRL